MNISTSINKHIVVKKLSELNGKIGRFYYQQPTESDLAEGKTWGEINLLTNEDGELTLYCYKVWTRPEGNNA